MKRVHLVATMGTVVSLDVRTPVTTEAFEAAADAVTRRLGVIDDELSAWRGSSWVSRLVSGVVRPEDCPSDVQCVVELAIDLMELTDGYFSPFWRCLPYGDPGPDPTGLVKGWAAQQASDVLLSRGLVDHVVNAAGDVVVSGCSDPDEPSRTWRIGISDPHRAGDVAGVVELDHRSRRWAVATSGTAELGAHVSDPHTGRFPRTVASATALTRIDDSRGRGDEGGAVADACATALVAAGEAAPDLVTKLGQYGVEVLLLMVDGSVQDPRGLLTPA